MVLGIGTRLHVPNPGVNCSKIELSFGKRSAEQYGTYKVGSPPFVSLFSQRKTHHHLLCVLKDLQQTPLSIVQLSTVQRGSNIQYPTAIMDLRLCVRSPRLDRPSIL